jgi:hypothetical protein
MRFQNRELDSKHKFQAAMFIKQALLISFNTSPPPEDIETGMRCLDHLEGGTVSPYIPPPVLLYQPFTTEAGFMCGFAILIHPRN